jgi:hypothetical protein
LDLANKDVLVRYLLGDLSQFDRERLEKECLADDELLEELHAVENDLMDSYVRGDLSANRQRQFEEKFLNSPERCERLEVAKLLMDPAVRARVATIPTQSQKKPGRGWGVWSGTPRLQFAFGCGLVVALTAVILAVQNWRLHAELAKLRSEQIQQQRQTDALQQRLSKPSAAAGGENTQDHSETKIAQVLSPPSEVAFRLIAGQTRQAGASNVVNLRKIPSGASTVVFDLELEKDLYSRYDVVLETDEGKQLQHIVGLKSEPFRDGGRMVKLRLPSQLFRKGDYVVTLYGQGIDRQLHPVDSYTFIAR